MGDWESFFLAKRAVDHILYVSFVEFIAKPNTPLSDTYVLYTTQPCLSPTLAVLLLTRLSDA